MENLKLTKKETDDLKLKINNLEESKKKFAEICMQLARLEKDKNTLLDRSVTLETDLLNFLNELIERRELNSANFVLDLDTFEFKIK